MPILSSNKTTLSIETLLKDLTFVLPDFSTTNIDVAEIMTFDQGDLAKEYQEDLLLLSFFKMLQVELQRRVSAKTHEQDDYESDRLGVLRTNPPEGMKLTEAALKEMVYRDPVWRRFREDVAQLKTRLSSVDAMVSLLEKKAIALNVMTAKARAELGAGLQS